MVTYNRDIPDAPNNPSNDQPKMKVNTNAIDDLLAVDHVSFNTANGGFHKRVTFNNTTAPVAPTDPQSILYTQAGTASSVSELAFINQNATFRLSALKAFGVFTTVNVNGAVAIGMASNVASITSSSSGSVYTIALTPGAVNGTTVIVFTNNSAGTGTAETISWAFAANTLTLTIGSNVVGRRISFAILQV